jgi:hypothetical protein
LYGSLRLIFSLLVFWLTYETDDLIKGLRYFNYLRAILGLGLGFGQFFLAIAAGSLHHGLVALDGHLWFRVRDKALSKPWYWHPAVPHGEEKMDSRR